MGYLIIAILLMATPAWAKPTLQKDGLTYTLKSRSKIKDSLMTKGYKNKGKIVKMTDITREK